MPDLDEKDTSWRKAAVSMLVIYTNPKDFPGKVVGRWHHSLPDKIRIDKMPAFIVDNLQDAQAQVPPGMHRLERHPSDDSVITEVWI